MAHHVLADLITSRWHRVENGTTIRGGTADAWVPRWLLVVRNYFAGAAQFGATAALLGAVPDPFDAAMLSLAPIQVGAFVNTLTKKHILGSLGHGVIYGGLLLVSYVFMAVNNPVVLLYMAGCLLARKMGTNKYLVLMALYAVIEARH